MKKKIHIKRSSEDQAELYLKRLAGTSAHKAMTLGLKGRRDGRRYK
jgi:hypothetical protein